MLGKAKARAIALYDHNLRLFHHYLYDIPIIDYNIFTSARCRLSEPSQPARPKQCARARAKPSARARSKPSYSYTIKPSAMATP